MPLSDSERFKIHHGDAIPHMMEDMPPESVDFSVFSPPFPAMYSYTSLAEDIGNSEDFRGSAKLHLSFFYKALARVLKPGRVAAVHVMQIPRMKRTGETGLHDFRGLNIRLAERSGLVFEYDWAISKNPQCQALRTKSHSLQFAGLEKDRAGSRGALPDYILKFRAPGENKVPINSKSQVSRDDWIRWAESVWTWHEIRETDTLNVAEGRGEDDTRHICPIQIPVVERLVKLFSNPGELVFSPFAGIGTEGYVSLKLGRRFYGCEIKHEYHRAALQNLRRAAARPKTGMLPGFDLESA